MPPRRKVVSYDDDSSSSESEEEEQTQDSLEENLKSFVDCIDNDTLVSIFKDVVCKSLRDVVSVVGSSASSPNNDALFSTFKDAACNAFRVAMSTVGPSTSTKAKKRDEHGTKVLSHKTSTRFNVSYFSEVINSLDERKKNVIKSYGFGSLLQFDKCAVPLSFASWIAQHVDVSNACIVVKGNSIPMSQESVRAVLGLPIGGTPIERDKMNSKPAFLKLINTSSLPYHTFFGKKLLGENLNDDEIVRCFLVVALSTFLCPTGCVKISPDYLSPLLEIKDAKNWDWSKLVCDWLLRLLKKYQRQIKAQNHSSASLGGCLYYLCVLYLDHLELPLADMPAATIPRIKVYRGDMIKRFAEFDRVDSNSYGQMNVKDTVNTCYLNAWSVGPSSSELPPSNNAPDDNAPELDPSSFRVLLEPYVDQFSPQVFDELVQIYAKHAPLFSCSDHGKLQMGFLDVIKFFYDASRMEKSFDSSQQAHHLFQRPYARAASVQDAEHNRAFDTEEGAQDAEEGAQDESESRAPTDDTFVIPSNAGMGSDGQDHRKKRKSGLSGEFDSESPTSAQSIGVRTRSHQPPSLGVDRLEAVLKRNRKKRGAGKKNSHTDTSGTKVENIDDDEDESVRKDDTCGVHIYDKQGQRSSGAANMAILNRKNRKSVIVRKKVNTPATDVDFDNIYDDICDHNKPDISRSQYEATDVLNASNIIGTKSSQEKGGGDLPSEAAGQDPLAENSSSFKHMLETDVSTKKRSFLYDFEAPSCSLGLGFNSDESSQSQDTTPVFDNSKHPRTDELNDQAPSPVLSSGVILLSMTTDAAAADDGSRCDAQFDATPVFSRFGASPLFDHSVQNEDAGADTFAVPAPLAMIDHSGKFVVLSSQEAEDEAEDEDEPRTPQNDCSEDVVIIGQSSGYMFHSSVQNASAMYDQAMESSSFQRCCKINFQFESTSSGKLSKYRSRRLKRPNSFFHDFETVSSVARFNVTPQVRLFYECAMFYGLEDACYQNQNVIDYDRVRVSFAVLAESMRRDKQDGGVVSTYVMNAFCRKLFLDSHPRHSKKHFFFSTVGDHLMGNTSSVSEASIDKSFEFAQNAYLLHSSHMLFFSILHRGHWFAFIVDIRDKFFVFLDCYFSDDSDYQQNVKRTIIPNFLKMWDKNVGEYCSFESFGIHYPTVPKLVISEKEFFRSGDDGIFTMKFLELWDPYINMTNKFAIRNIGDIRALYVYDMVMSKHNQLPYVKSLLSDHPRMMRAKMARIRSSSSSVFQ